jgi:hypothetical protein
MNNAPLGVSFDVKARIPPISMLVIFIKKVS